MAIAAAILAVFVYGMVIVIPGSIKLRLVDRVGMDDAQVGRMLMLWQGTTLILTVVIGPVLDRLGHRGVMACGFVLVAAALWRFAGAVQPSGVFVAAALLGAGGSCLNTAGNTLLPMLNPANPASASNLGNMFFGLGAFVVPFVIAYLFQQLHYRSAVAVLAVVPVLALIPALTAHYPRVAPVIHLSATLSLLQSQTLLLGGCMLFCMVGLEVSTASWTTTYLRKIGLPVLTSPKNVSGIPKIWRRTGPAGVCRGDGGLHGVVPHQREGASHRGFQRSSESSRVCPANFRAGSVVIRMGPEVGGFGRELLRIVLAVTDDAISPSH